MHLLRSTKNNLSWGNKILAINNSFAILNNMESNKQKQEAVENLTTNESKPFDRTDQENIDRLNAKFEGSGTEQPDQSKRVENLVKGLSFASGSEEWKSIKEQIDEAGVNKNDIPEYGIKVTKIFDEALDSRDSVEALQAVVEIFGEDAMTPARKQTLLDKGNQWIEGQMRDLSKASGPDLGTIEAGVKYLKIAGISNSEIAEKVYSLALQKRVLDQTSQLDSVVPGLYDLRKEKAR
jgi:hypothetical protein